MIFRSHLSIHIQFNDFFCPIISNKISSALPLRINKYLFVSTQHSRLHPAASGVKQELACQATGNLECAERIACGFVTAQVLSSYISFIISSQVQVHQRQPKIKACRIL